MKVIFSRKGFDSKYGGGCSPILPDGRLLSLPIPSKSIENGIPYSELSTTYGSYKSIMQSLRIKLPEDELAHLDPDLVNSIYPRETGWRSVFGQTGAASTHLSNEIIEPGDIFLFFGSFRKTMSDHLNRLSFSEPIVNHIIFGYLIVDRIIKVGDYDMERFIESFPEYKWAFYHPHLINNKYGKQNTIYIGKDFHDGIPGHGSFYYNEKLVLTNDNSSKSIWQLPKFFHPIYGTRISRHLNESRFVLRNNYLELATVGIGQEFVVSGNKQTYKWAEKIIKDSLKYY